jgi:hypothetical protein
MIDLNNVDPQSVKALTRLREPGNEAVLRLLRSELEAAKQKLVYAGDTALIHRLQGRAEAFEDLLRAAEESAEVLR